MSSQYAFRVLVVFFVYRDRTFGIPYGHNQIDGCDHEAKFTWDGLQTFQKRE
jgi:hypothetical protein